MWSAIPNALNAAAWTFLSLSILKIRYDLVFISLSAVFAWIFYTKDRLYPNQEDHVNNIDKVIWYQKHMKIPFIIIIPVCITLLLLRYSIIPLALTGTLLTFLYVHPIKILKKKIIIKNVFLGKVVFTALMWLLLTVFFSYYYYGSTVSTFRLIQLSSYIFMIIGIQIIINDIDDLVGDKKATINTIPVLFGIEKTKIILYFIAICSMLVGWNMYPTINLILFTVLIIIHIKSYSEAYSYQLKFLNGSLGYIAGIGLNPVLMGF